MVALVPTSKLRLTSALQIRQPNRITSLLTNFLAPLFIFEISEIARGEKETHE